MSILSKSQTHEWIVARIYKKTGYSNAIARRKNRRNARVVLKLADRLTLSLPDAAAEYNRLAAKCEVVVWGGAKRFGLQIADCPMSELDGAD